MWPLFVSIRYFLANRQEKFISIISIISVLGVALGVAALIVVISVMTGFDEEIKDKIIGTYAHIIVTSGTGISDTEAVIRKLKEDKNILAVSSFIERQALLRTGERVIGILLRGIDEKNEPYVSNIKHFTRKGVLDLGNFNLKYISFLPPLIMLSPMDEKKWRKTQGPLGNLA